MLFIASFWVALINLALLVCALAFNHQALANPAWFLELPWPWFGTELAAVLDMQPVEAGALWALWMGVSALLCLGSGLSYAFAAQAARAAKRPPAPTPQVAMMWRAAATISSSLPVGMRLASPNSLRFGVIRLAPR